MQDSTSKPPPASSDAGEGHDAGRDSKPAPRTLDVSGTLSALPIDMDLIADPIVKHAMQVLLNLVERQAAEIVALREENQRLRDEINRLKGEQGKPDVKAPMRTRDVSSEKERRKREKLQRRRKRKAKRNKITVHRTRKCLVAEELALCWVHDGRHYKKLEPVVPHHAELLTAFRERYWDFYAELLAFKARPTDAEARRLSKKFDTVFATKTGYDALDERIAKTRARKEMLLAAHLRHPELPLHNNACELEARVAARRRDVSLHTRTDEGTAACDTMNSIVRTAKKLGVSAFEYIRDRVSRLFRLQSLADMIRQRAAAAARS